MEKAESAESKFSFKLFLRIRPQKNGKTDLMDYLNVKDSKHLRLEVPEDSVTFKNGRIEADFEYSEIFVPSTTQERVFDVTTKSLLDGFLKGQSCLIMAYGVTGSGKTYTIMGPEGNQGLIPRSLHYIINGMGTFDFKSRFDKEDEKVTLEMSFLEDYQNCIYDLLSPTIRVGQSKPMLNARSDANGFLHIINLTEKQISSLSEGMEVIAMGTKEKHVAETKMNLDSSRSHTMCTFNLVRTNKQFMREIIATCRIVDLAGSERLNRTNASGERSQEAGHINTDLMYLMQCLRSLVDSQSKPNQRVIFRNCRLTHLLSTSLVGSMAGPVHLIVNISNEKGDFDETFSALEQITIAKSIKIVQSKVDSKPMPVQRSAGGRRLNPFGDDSALLSSRVLNGADVERLKRLLREKDAEVRQLREHFDHELQAAMDGREVEVRRQIVEEIQKRKENGESEESQVRVMIEGIKKTYEMMVATAESSLKTELREKDAKIEELNRMITDLNDDVLRLQSLYDLVTNSSDLNPEHADQIVERLNSYMDQIYMMRGAMDNLNDQINTLQEDLKASTDSEASLKAENASLRSQIDSLTASLAQSKQKQASLELKVREYQTMADSAIQQAAEQRARELSADDTLRLRGSITSIKKLTPPSQSPRTSPPPLPAASVRASPPPLPGSPVVSPVSPVSPSGTLRSALAGSLRSAPSFPSLRASPAPLPARQPPPGPPPQPPAGIQPLRPALLASPSQSSLLSPASSPHVSPRGSPVAAIPGRTAASPRLDAIPRLNLGGNPPPAPISRLHPPASPRGTRLQAPGTPPAVPAVASLMGSRVQIAGSPVRKPVQPLNLPAAGGVSSSGLNGVNGSGLGINGVNGPNCPNGPNGPNGPGAGNAVNPPRLGRFAGKNMTIEIGSPTTQKSGHFTSFGSEASPSAGHP